MTSDPDDDDAFQRLFPDDQAAFDYLVKARWPDGFCCPACACRHAFELPRRRLWQCIGCGLQTSVTSRTALHATKVHLRTWLHGLWAMSHDEDTTSAAALQRATGIGTYRTAWTLLQKVRRALTGATHLRAPLHDVDVSIGRVGRAALCKASATTAPAEGAWVVAAATGTPGHLFGPRPAAARLGLGSANLALQRPSGGEWSKLAPEGVAVPHGHRAENVVACLTGWLIRSFGGVSRRYAWAYVQEFVHATRHEPGLPRRASLVRQILGHPWTPARALGERPAWA